jgi:hypothetical protein
MCQVAPLRVPPPAIGLVKTLKALEIPLTDRVMAPALLPTRGWKIAVVPSGIAATPNAAMYFNNPVEVKFRLLISAT